MSTPAVRAGTPGDGPATELSAEAAARQIVPAMADAYRRRGYHQIAIPASALLPYAGASLELLEAALGVLLDARGVVPVGSNGVALHPSARTALLSRTVLAGWFSAIAGEAPVKVALYRDGIAGEISDLVNWACGHPDLPDDLTQRAAELAGVLATPDLDPQAMEIVATHGGTPRGKLSSLAALKPRSLPCERLRDHLRNTVSSAQGR